MTKNKDKTAISTKSYWKKPVGPNQINYANKVVYLKKLEKSILENLQDDPVALPNIKIVDSYLVLDKYRNDIGMTIDGVPVLPSNKVLNFLWRMFGWKINITLVNGLPVDEIAVIRCTITTKEAYEAK